ncbi:MAG: nucleotidyltransferase family protein [Armatimonadota bacterium]
MSTPVRLAVIPSAGRGKRMMPLTADRPKPLIPIAGTPILERILLGIRAAGIERAVIITGYLGDMIRDYFGAGERVGVQLSYREQDPPNGTGGALLLVEDLCGDEPFMLHWGDILVDPVNYPGLLKRFAQETATPACTMGLNWVDDPCAGAAVYVEGECMVKVIEKPAPGTSTTNYNASGVMALGPQVWSYLHRITQSPRGEYEFTDAVHMMIEAGETMIGYPLAGLWSDVGTPEVVERLNANWDERLNV